MRPGMGYKLLRRQLPQHILQDAAVLEVLDLLRSIDAYLGIELLFRPIGGCGNHRNRAPVLEFEFSRSKIRECHKSLPR